MWDLRTAGQDDVCKEVRKKAERAMRFLRMAFRERTQEGWRLGDRAGGNFGYIRDPGRCEAGGSGCSCAAFKPHLFRDRSGL